MATHALLRELVRTPNLVSLARVPLGGLVWLEPTSIAWVLGLAALAGASDLLDGYLGRRAGGVDDLDHVGSWLDPLCDKAFIASAFAAIWLVVGPPWWLAALAGTREILVASSLAVKWLRPSLRHRPIPWRALASGKAATVAQFAFFAAVLFQQQPTWPWLASLAGALGVIAGGQYLLRAARALDASAGAPVTLHLLRAARVERGP